VKVRLYYKPGCFSCGTIASMLTSHGIEFEHCNVFDDPQAAAFLEARNILSVPVTVVDERIIVGLDTARLRDELGLSAGRLVDDGAGR
jgi:arsenate reductase-like glutaredoxin family protein